VLWISPMMGCPVWDFPWFSSVFPGEYRHSTFKQITNASFQILTSSISFQTIINAALGKASINHEQKIDRNQGAEMSVAFDKSDSATSAAHVTSCSSGSSFLQHTNVYGRICTLCTLSADTDTIYAQPKVAFPPPPTILYSLIRHRRTTKASVGLHAEFTARFH
jgi:hypothetical protein